MSEHPNRDTRRECEWECHCIFQGDPEAVAVAFERHLAAHEAMTNGAAGLIVPPGQEDDFVQVGTWLLPAAYGNDYDHFTQTTMQTKPDVCVALYAKADDLIGTPAEYRLGGALGEG